MLTRVVRIRQANVLALQFFLQRNIFRPKQFNQKQTLPLLLLKSTTGTALAFAAPVSRENGSTAANQQRY